MEKPSKAAGITAYSTYIPRHRLPREVIAAAWGSRALPGARAVANFDEDPLTMGQAAAWPLRQACEPDSLFFASCSSPYWQRSSASVIAAFCDLPTTTATTDLGGSVRVGTMALRAALDAVRSGSSRAAMVVCADARDGAPESTEEMIFGDGAAAIAVGLDHVIAEVIAQVSRSDDFLDEWRRDVDIHVRSFSSKFSTSRGYEAAASAAGRALLEQAVLKSDQISRAAIAAPDGKSHLRVAKALGIAAERIEDSRLGDIGVTGAAMPLLLLAGALDHAKPGDVILCIGYGDGADGFLFRVTEEIQRHPKPRARSNRSIIHSSYQVYRKCRDFLRDEATAPEISNVLFERQESQNVRLHGTFCSACTTLQFPITGICSHCNSKQGLVEKPLGRTGRLFTFNKDYLYESPLQPTMMAVVDLDGGGRFLCQMTDANEGDVSIGMNMELMVRRMRGAASMHHYYWKCRPED